MYKIQFIHIIKMHLPGIIMCKADAQETVLSKVNCNFNMNNNYYTLQGFS